MRQIFPCIFVPGILLAVGLPTPTYAADYYFGGDTPPFVIDANGTRSIAGVHGTSFIESLTPDGIVQFKFLGDLKLESDDTVHLRGDKPISFLVGGDAVIATGAVIDASANGRVPGAGGGLGGFGGQGGEGGTGGYLVYNIPRPGFPPQSFLGGGPGGNGAEYIDQHQPLAGGDWYQEGDTGHRGEAGFAGLAGDGGQRSGSGGLGFNSPSNDHAMGVNGGSGGDASDNVAQGGVGGIGGKVDKEDLGPLAPWIDSDPVKDLRYAERGKAGQNGAQGDQGGTGTFGIGGRHDAAADSLLLVGGNGGSGGAGGGGGAGGNTGAGGGGGGAGAFGRDGGDGGRGGTGGEGGTGAAGGGGGGGGGAFELRALGRIVMHGSVLARGSDGEGGGFGQAGEAGQAGIAGSAGSNTSDPKFQSGTSGAGGYGGNGGGGGRGGYGGIGGGGAGGTIKLVASDLDLHDGATYDARGADGSQTDSPRGEDGRLLLGSSSVLGPVRGNAEAKTTHTYHADITADNPYAGLVYLGPGKGYDGYALTPLIPNVIGGAEGFGLMEDYTAETLPGSAIREAIEDARNDQFAALLVRWAATSFFTGAEFANFDIVAFINLMDDPLMDPAFRAGSFVDPEALLQGGWMHDPLFGGDGVDEILGALPAGGIYLTLVSEDRGQNRDSGMIAQFSWHDQFFSGSWLGLGQKILPIGKLADVDLPPTADPVPEPGTLALMLAGGLLLLRCRYRRTGAGLCGKAR